VTNFDQSLSSSHPSDAWTGRMATEDDAPKILELLVRTFGIWPLYDIPVAPLEHLRWKLFTRDDVRDGQIVIDDGDTIVGLNGFFRQWFKVNDRLRHTHQVVDLAVLPTYQNRGVVSATRRFAVSDRIPICDVLLGPQARVESRERILRTGKWDPAPRANTYLQVQVLEGPVIEVPNVVVGDWALCSPSRFDERIQTFWDEASQPFALIAAHDVAFLNWRYCDPRAGEWTLRTAEASGEILGYITYRVSKGSGHIGGLLALPGRLDVIDSLLRDMMGALAALGVPNVRCWSSPGHPYRAALQAVGIDKMRRQLYWTIHAPGDDFSELADPSATIHLVAGDADLI
jgi:hypothetical protein